MYTYAYVCTHVHIHTQVPTLFQALVVHSKEMQSLVRMAAPAMAASCGRCWQISHKVSRDEEQLSPWLEEGMDNSVSSMPLALLAPSFLLNFL